MDGYLSAHLIEKISTWRNLGRLTQMIITTDRELWTIFAKINIYLNVARRSIFRVEIEGLKMKPPPISDQSRQCTARVETVQVSIQQPICLKSHS